MNTYDPDEVCTACEKRAAVCVEKQVIQGKRCCKNCSHG